MFKPGDTVILKSFTGMSLCKMRVVAADQNLMTVLKKDGTQMFFSQKTGKQIIPKPRRPAYASSIIPDDGKFKEPNKKTRRRNI